MHPFSSYYTMFSLLGKMRVNISHECCHHNAFILHLFPSHLMVKKCQWEVTARTDTLRVELKIKTRQKMIKKAKSKGKWMGMPLGSRISSQIACSISLPPSACLTLPLVPIDQHSISLPLSACLTLPLVPIDKQSRTGITRHFDASLNSKFAPFFSLIDNIFLCPSTIHAFHFCIILLIHCFFGWYFHDPIIVLFVSMQYQLNGDGSIIRMLGTVAPRRSCFK